jgi:hypothetical protein
LEVSTSTLCVHTIPLQSLLKSSKHITPRITGSFLGGQSPNQKTVLRERSEVDAFVMLLEFITILIKHSMSPCDNHLRKTILVCC